MSTASVAPVALVTGGNRGIGLAIAEKLKAEGFTTVVTYRSGSAPAGFEGVVMDVSNSESVTAAFVEIEERFGAVEVLVANAGITRDGLAMRMSDEDFQSKISVSPDRPNHGQHHVKGQPPPL